MARAFGCCLFDTAIGACGIAWSDAGIAAVQLPEADRPATLRRLRRHVGEQVPEADPPAALQAAISRIRGSGHIGCWSWWPGWGTT